MTDEKHGGKVKIKSENTKLNTPEDLDSMCM